MQSGHLQRHDCFVSCPCKNNVTKVRADIHNESQSRTDDQNHLHFGHIINVMDSADALSNVKQASAAYSFSQMMAIG